MKSYFLSNIFILILTTIISCQNQGEGGETVTIKNPINQDYLIGKWRFQNEIYTFNADSTYSLRTKDYGLLVGKWYLEANILFLEGQFRASYNITKIWDDSFLAKEGGNSKFEKFE